MQLLAVVRADVFAIQKKLPGGRRDQLEHGLAHRRLATAGLAHQCQRATGSQTQADPIDRTHVAHGSSQQALAHRKMHAQIVHFEHRRRSAPTMQRRRQ